MRIEYLEVHSNILIFGLVLERVTETVYNLAILKLSLFRNITL